MAKGRFLVAPFKAGLQENVRPWLIAEDAFETMSNAYIFRDRIRKRPGTTLLNDGTSSRELASEQLSARLRISVDTTDGAGNSTPGVTVPLTGGSPITANIGSMFSVGTQMFTVYQANGAMYSTGAATGTFNTATGAFTITGADPAAAVYFYPALPVMGIVQYETLLVNDEPTYAFDTKFAYQYASNGWLRLGTAFWTGSDSDFFWGRVWRGLNASERYLFATNFYFGSTLNDSDPIRYWDGAAWNNFQPAFTSTVATNTILQARVILPFKNRLVLMNIIENTGVAPGTNTQYGNRIRFSQNGSPVSADAWYEDVAGKGGYIDAPTQEQIVSAEFVRDRLIVFFERSTYELVYTGNEILPFRFQKINDVLGVESTFSVVQFDNYLAGVGDVGIHAASSTTVQRIDNKIPDVVTTISNDNNGAKRVHGIRDYYGELVYWGYMELSTTFPDKVLLYNYRNNTWAKLDDTFTAFGYFNNQGDRVWQAELDAWEGLDVPWNSGTLNKGNLSTVAGNHQGYVHFIDIDKNYNDPAMQITAITTPDTLTVYNHNLRAGDYIELRNMGGVTMVDSEGNPTTITRVFTFSDANTIIIDGTTPLSGTYTGGGTVSRVSQPSIYTKQYNFYINEGYCFDVDKVDIHADITALGEIAVQWFINAADQGTPLGEQSFETYPNIQFYPYELFSERVWRTIYPEGEGQFVQFRYFFNDAQMRDINSARAPFTLHAFIYYASATRDRME